MRTAALALVSALVVAGGVVALAIRQRAEEWRRWEALDQERAADDIDWLGEYATSLRPQGG